MTPRRRDAESGGGAKASAARAPGSPHGGAGEAAATPAAKLISGAALHALNRSCNQFLGIDAKEIRLVARHRRQLAETGGFAEMFYQFLLSHKATTKVLREFERSGGSIDALVRTQHAHLEGLLRARIDAASAEELIRLGAIHYRRGVEPLWVMGGYQLYAEFLLKTVEEHAGIARGDKRPLQDALLRLVFRDLGLMTEGYWLAASQAIRSKHEEVVRLKERIDRLHANIPQLLWSVDVGRNRPIYVSPVARQICGVDVEMPIPCLGWTVEGERDLVRGAWGRALAGESVEVETQVRTPDGALRWFRRVFYPYRNRRGTVVRIDGVMEDVTDARELGERVRRLATTDSLTGLPNRTLFYDRVERAVALAERDSGGGTVLMFLDLDRFKEVNDALGHQVGDRVLVAVAERIALSLRDSDTVARIGGDEFGILLPHAGNPSLTAKEVAEKILADMSQPVRIDDREFFVGASIGIVFSPEHGVEPETLIRRADSAMYACKGRDVRYLVYDPALEASVTQRLQLANDLQRALGRGELLLQYQPIVSIGDGRVVGVEALARWNHPVLGLVAPDRFIPLAERSGLIVSVTDWVVESALAQAGRLRARGWPLRIAVNVSGRVFRDPSLTERVGRILAATSAGSDALEVEVTENVLMSEVEQVGRTLEKLRHLGVRTAMDDFGSGYSSLSYLKRLPIDRIKIDKSLVLDIARDPASTTIVRAIVDLGHDLGREVVAEGVETDDALALLRGLGCDAVQGYHVCPPLSAEGLEGWLASRAASA